MEDMYLEEVIQLIQSQGLWLQHVAKDGGSFESHEFQPVVAIALVRIRTPHDRYFLKEAIVPVTSDDLMRGLLDRTPNEGLRIKRNIFHDCDFETLGHKLKDGAKPRAYHDYTLYTGLDMARFIQDLEIRREAP